MKFKKLYSEQDDILKSHYYHLSKDSKKEYFNGLRKLAESNLSLAHCIQHDQAAKITLLATQSDLAKADNFLDYVASNSTYKTVDDCYIRNNKLYGSKKYVSGATFTDYSIVYVKNEDTKTIDNVFLWNNEYSTDISTFKPIGMEDTLTGDLVFDGINIDSTRLITSKGTAEIRHREQFMDIAFPTNCIGVTFGLFELIKNNIPHHSDLDKLYLDICVYEKVWNNSLNTMIDSNNDTEYYNEMFLLYGLGKKTLNALIKYILNNGTGFFYQNTKQTQIYRDAMIYTSHMNNYQKSVTEFNRHRKNYE